MNVTKINNQQTNFKGGAVALRGATAKYSEHYAEFLIRKGILEIGDSFEYLCFPNKGCTGEEIGIVDALDKAGALCARTTLGADVSMEYVKGMLSGERLSMPKFWGITRN